jgi:hypothetical protein
MSIIAYTIFVGLHVKGSRSAMFCTLMFSAFIAFWTMLSFFKSSTFCMCAGLCCLGFVCASTYCSYFVIAASILASTFLSICSSLTPSFPCSADSVRAGAVFFSAFALLFPKLSLFTSAVRVTILASAASRRAISLSTLVWSGVGCPVETGCFTGC